MTVRKAVAAATVVAVGEDHLSQEIPSFAIELCRMMSSDLGAVVVEAGPIATKAVADTMHRPGGKARRTEFARRYPNAVAFLDFESEYEFASRCTTHARLVGVDQEFLGAGALIIDKILDTKLSPSARRALVAAKADDARRSAAAAITGDPSGLTMLALSDADFDRLGALLATGGTKVARSMLAAMRASHDIYAISATSGAQSNATRAALMKQSFAKAVPAGTRTLIKLGDWHLYKGVNPLNQRDIGNMIAEVSDLRGIPSLHILVLGTAGDHATFSGYAKPAGIEPFKIADDENYRWTKAASEAAYSTGWTVFDLRQLRHQALSNVSPDWRRVFDGYDLLVLIPQLHAAKP